MDNAETTGGTVGVPQSSATSPANSAEEQVQRETMRKIRIYQAQLLFREKEMIGRRMEHQENIDVARLAIELARLRGTCEPVAHLEEAAMLLTKARLALAHEAERPRREAENSKAEALAAFSTDGMIAFALLFESGKGKKGDGGMAGTEVFKYEEKEFHWKKFTSERGFQKLLRKHAERIGQEGGEELANLLAAKPVKLDSARDLVRQHLLVSKQEMAELNRMEAPDEIRRFYETRKEASATQFANRLWKDIKKDSLDVETLYSLSRTRHAGNSARATKGSHAKANKSRRQPGRQGTVK
jgi:hypothetical protein